LGEDKLASRSAGILPRQEGSILFSTEARLGILGGIDGIVFVWFLPIGSVVFQASRMMAMIPTVSCFVMKLLTISSDMLPVLIHLIELESRYSELLLPKKRVDLL
jgi:hypothetical protein